VSTTDPRAAYAAYVKSEIEDFRAHQGQPTKGAFVGRQLLLLTTIGARTGEPRISPLAYTIDHDRVIIVASKGGAPSHPAWYSNLLANPTVTVEIGAETYQARASVITGSERDRLYAQHADLHPTFHDYPKKTDRIIPVIALDRLD
jgi:deazaflavin-dependent oxidoreductase (nitroreductase family)